jgi:hypothetical protein
MEKTTTKEFLQLCHEQVVTPALENGLDEECYYRYLCEIYRALEGDSGVRRKYRKMLSESWENMIVRFNPNSDTIWLHCYEDVFKRQTNFMLELGSFACASVKDDATRALAQAVMNFIQLQLHTQKRVLDCIGKSVCPGSKAKAAGKEYDSYMAAMDRYDLMRGFLKGSIEQLDSISY